MCYLLCWRRLSPCNVTIKIYFNKKNYPQTPNIGWGYTILPRKFHLYLININELDKYLTFEFLQMIFFNQTQSFSQNDSGQPR